VKPRTSDEPTAAATASAAAAPSRCTPTPTVSALATTAAPPHKSANHIEADSSAGRSQPLTDANRSDAAADAAMSRPSVTVGSLASGAIASDQIMLPANPYKPSTIQPPNLKYFAPSAGRSLTAKVSSEPKPICSRNNKETSVSDMRRIVGKPEPRNTRSCARAERPLDARNRARIDALSEAA
jgi:hypothetical protein